VILATFVHRIDPTLGQLGRLHFWWYGLGYALGFLQLHLFLMRRRRRIGLTRSDVYALSLYVSIGVLLGGRLIEVSFDEWPFYRDHPLLIPA
jgi:prolipoprotein diacylglyceryltransferase